MIIQNATLKSTTMASWPLAPIVTSGLLLQLDASNASSYSGTGTTWSDISGNAYNATINGTIPFVSAGQASYFNWATQADANYIYSTTASSYVDITIVFYPDFTLTSQASLSGLIASGPLTDESLRFGGANGIGPWALQNPDNTNGWASTATTYYVNGTAYTGAGNLSSGWNILGGYRTNQTSYPLSSPYYLGTGYASRGFRGRVAVCLLYNRQLSAAEQTQNFNALRGRFGL